MGWGHKVESVYSEENIVCKASPAQSTTNLGSDPCLTSDSFGSDNTERYEVSTEHVEAILTDHAHLRPSPAQINTNSELRHWQPNVNWAAAGPAQAEWYEAIQQQIRTGIVVAYYNKDWTTYREEIGLLISELKFQCRLDGHTMPSLLRGIEGVD